MQERWTRLLARRSDEEANAEVERQRLERSTLATFTEQQRVGARRLGSSVTNTMPLFRNAVVIVSA